MVYRLQVFLTLFFPFPLAYDLYWEIFVKYVWSESDSGELPEWPKLNKLFIFHCFFYLPLSSVSAIFRWLPLFTNSFLGIFVKSTLSFQKPPLQMFLTVFWKSCNHLMFISSLASRCSTVSNLCYSFSINFLAVYFLPFLLTNSISHLLVVGMVWRNSNLLQDQPELNMTGISTDTPKKVPARKAMKKGSVSQVRKN